MDYRVELRAGKDYAIEKADDPRRWRNGLKWNKEGQIVLSAAIAKSRRRDQLRRLLKSRHPCRNNVAGERQKAIDLAEFRAIIREQRTLLAS